MVPGEVFNFPAVVAFSRTFSFKHGLTLMLFVIRIVQRRWVHGDFVERDFMRHGMVTRVRAACRKMNTDLQPFRQAKARRDRVETVTHLENF